MAEGSAALEENPILDRWHVKHMLAKGSFSFVNKVVNKTFATDIKCLKVILKTNIKPQELTVLRQSYDVLDSVSHRHIVRLRERCETSEGIFMIFDLCRGGTLFDRVQKFACLPEQEAAKIMYQAGSALQYLHSRNIIYRDLKAEHILLTESGDDYDVVLSGSDVVIQSEDAITEFAGTPGYVAPEILRREPFHTAVDIWSLGVTLYIVLSGLPPFDDNDSDLRVIYGKCKSGEYDFKHEYWNNVSSGAKTFIRQMMEMDPETRVTAEQVVNHDWVQKYSGKLGEVEN